MRYRGGAFHQTLAIPPRAFRSCGIWLVRTSNLHSAGACAALLKDHSWIDRLSSRVRVLVVDDDDDGRAVMKLSLELDGARVDDAVSALAALDTLATMTPDVMVTAAILRVLAVRHAHGAHVGVRAGEASPPPVVPADARERRAQALRRPRKYARIRAGAVSSVG